MKTIGTLLAIAIAGACNTFAEQAAPKTEPPALNEVNLFERINRREKIEFETLCQALVGSHFTLRAEAATLLGDSGDMRAIPFLIDALADNTEHVGANYADPGDATTRHRANKALIKLTKLDFGFVWNDQWLKRREAIQRWSAWYKKIEKPLPAKQTLDQIAELPDGATLADLTKMVGHLGTDTGSAIHSFSLRLDDGTSLTARARLSDKSILSISHQSKQGTEEQLYPKPKRPELPRKDQEWFR